MQTHELHLGPNGKAADLQTILETDGPAAVVLKNEGEAEYALAMKRGSNDRATAPTTEFQINDQVQVVFNPTDAAETDFEGVAKGNSPTPHPALITAADGVSSAEATRTLTSAGSDFVAAGVKPGDVLLVNKTAGTVNGTYIVVEVTSATVLTVDRDWPAATSVANDFWVYARCVVAPGSVTITLTIGAATITVTDDGEGVLYGVIVADTTWVNGVIDYFTGKWSIVCDTAPDNATDILLTYAESLPVVAGGKISYAISNARHAQPISFQGIGNGDNVKCNVTVFIG